MNVTALKARPAQSDKMSVGKVLPLPPAAPRSQWPGKIKDALLTLVLPPVAVIVTLLAIWQQALSGGGASLPSPLEI
jgi:hypothetical protein